MAIGRKPAEERLLAHAFALLLERREPIPSSELGDDATLRELDTAGRLRRDEAGNVVAAHGLSVVPSRHGFQIAGHRFWTWCAYDAFGIAGALEADAHLYTRHPISGQAREVRFTGGTPAGDGAVFLPSLDTCTSVVEQWCPHANVFDTVEEARHWADSEGMPGEAVAFAEASRRGTELWRAAIRFSDAFSTG